MTGQGSERLEADGVTVTVEVRTVNSRYFKLAMRASDGYSSFEPRIDELVRKRVRRGTVQLDLHVIRPTTSDDYRLNEDLLASYQKQLQRVAKTTGSPIDISLEALVALPGVVEELGNDNVDEDSDWHLIAKATKGALTHLTKMRQDEGEAMRVDLISNCDAIRIQLTEIESRAPLVAEQYRARLIERVNKFLGENDISVTANDVLREVSLFADRSDISEETVRLRSHLDQFREIMGSTESAGRKLEFITQEMFRETNTIGSKANDADIARSVVEIKAAIERIREMIQNIE